MMPMETTLSIPTEEPSLENIVIPNEDQTPMCLLPSNFDNLKQYRRKYPRLSSALGHEYIEPFRSQWNINNRMIPVGCCFNEHDGKNYSMIPFSFALNPSLVSGESSTSISNCNEINSTPKVNYENHVNQQYRYRQIYSLPPTSSISTSISPSAKAKREQSTRVRQLSAGQPLPPYPHRFAKPIISHHWPPLPLPSMTNALTRSNERPSPVSLIRTSNFVPLSLPDSSMPPYSPSTTAQQHFFPHQTVRQCSFDPRCNHTQRPLNLSDNRSYEHYYMRRSNPMFMNIPTMQYSTRLPRFDMAFSSRSVSNNAKTLPQERSDSQKSETIGNPSVEVPAVSKLNQHDVEKKSTTNDHRMRALVKRTKKKSKLAILKFMICKRKRQLSKKKYPKEAISKPSQTPSKSIDLLASNLRITFNTTQKIECISLYYHHRLKPHTQADDSLLALNTAENRLDLLIEAANFVEMNKNSA